MGCVGAFILSGSASAAIAAPMDSLEVGFGNNPNLETGIAILLPEEWAQLQSP